MPAGFLYVLINPSMPGLAKVGKTTRDPANRVLELSSATGVPSPFILAFQQPVNECDSAEIWVHRELERTGYRHTDNREFFNGPLHEIIQVVIQVANLAPVAAGEAIEVAPEHDNSGAEHLAEELYDLASQYRSGTDRVFKNDKKALELYEQAATLGHQMACFWAGNYYECGADSDVREDKDKALLFYQKAVHLGSWSTEATIAQLFQKHGNAAGAKAHWNLFFERAYEEMARAPENFGEVYAQSVGLYGYYYVAAVAMDEMPACVPDKAIVDFGEFILGYIAIRIQEVADDPNIPTESRRRFADYMTKRLQAARRYIKKLS